MNFFNTQKAAESFTRELNSKNFATIDVAVSTEQLKNLGRFVKIDNKSTTLKFTKVGFFELFKALVFSIFGKKSGIYRNDNCETVLAGRASLIANANQQAQTVAGTASQVATTIVNNNSSPTSPNRPATSNNNAGSYNNTKI